MINNPGVYYTASSNNLWYVTKVSYYEDTRNRPFLIINCYADSGFYERVLITEDQFSNFELVGSL